MNRRWSTSLLAGILAVVALSACVSSASAGRLSFSSREWTATWNSIVVTGGFGAVTCPALTLAGTFHSSTITKTSGSLIGYVTDARSPGGACSGTISGTTVLREQLPWHVRYRSFAGTLPNITSIAMNIVGFGYRVRESIFGIICLFRSTEAAPLVITWNRGESGAVTSTTMNETLRSDCEGTSAAFSGRGSLSATTITLI